MSKTLSNMGPLGTLAPTFSLQNVIDDKPYKLQQHDNKIATVIMFICNHCPYVKFINEALVQLANTYLKKNVNFIAINSNDVNEYPDDSPHNMKITAQNLQYPFPYLFDETQDVAKAYHAACTPDFFIYDKNLSLVYRGQFDDARPGSELTPTGGSIKEVLDALIHNAPINPIQKASMGCNIKWKI